ncbi:hypothetical protein [Cohnella lupini]|uniref:hypothetical protein n=1 Tax=Cohnella lupini TaxID=1294267 RepID=UPI001FE6062B|nr:hypothetical protein [Cohnella lupini]
MDELLVLKKKEKNNPLTIIGLLSIKLIIPNAAKMTCQFIHFATAIPIGTSNRGFLTKKTVFKVFNHLKDCFSFTPIVLDLKQT